MSIVADALYWMGLRHYLLADEDRVLGGRHVFEFDVTFPNLPGDLHGYVRGCLEEALQSGR